VERRAAPDAADGALWFPRPYQGEGRHDNPAVYGCLYLSEQPLSCVVEQLARFRGQRLTPALLRRRGLPLGLAELELPDDAQLVDLDEPAVLRRERLRPSRVATRERAITQPQSWSWYISPSAESYKMPKAMRGPPDALATPVMPRSGLRWTITAPPFASKKLSGPGDSINR
jgi:hypothetical protein